MKKNGREEAVVGIAESGIFWDPMGSSRAYV